MQLAQRRLSEKELSLGPEEVARRKALVDDKLSRRMRSVEVVRVVSDRSNSRSATMGRLGPGSPLPVYVAPNPKRRRKPLVTLTLSLEAGNGGWSIFLPASTLRVAGVSQDSTFQRWFDAATGAVNLSVAKARRGRRQSAFPRPLRLSWGTELPAGWPAVTGALLRVSFFPGHIAIMPTEGKLDSKRPKSSRLHIAGATTYGAPEQHPPSPFAHLGVPDLDWSDSTAGKPAFNVE